jgi:hypothetical protein
MYKKDDTDKFQFCDLTDFVIHLQGKRGAMSERT